MARPEKFQEARDDFVNIISRVACMWSALRNKYMREEDESELHALATDLLSITGATVSLYAKACPEDPCHMDPSMNMERAREMMKEDRDERL